VNPRLEENEVNVVDGHVAPGFECVRHAFAANFAKRQEVGAAFAACVDGELVVDLWGGWLNERRDQDWSRDSLQFVFSGTKGLVATVVLLLIDRGLLSLDDRVSRYWPEFAANGKTHVTIAEVLSHRAGIPAIEAPVRPDDMLDDVTMAGLVASQAPLWPPGDRVAYHALTYGWIAGELVRRVTGASIGQFFASEIAEPLRLETWIGLPASLESRVSTISLHDSFRRARRFAEEREGFTKIRGNPIPYIEPLVWNLPAFHQAEIPAVNGITTARSMARLYGCLACGGRLGAVALARKDSVAGCIEEQSRGTDQLTGEWLAFAAGFMLQTPYAFLGPTAEGFGHGGAGGSIHGGWPSKRTGFSYVMNQMRDEVTDDRSRVLLASLYTAIANRVGPDFDAAPQLQ
jgi:CubicO group peptidase (beta-lactamase class C family)